MREHEFAHQMSCQSIRDKRKLWHYSWDKGSRSPVSVGFVLWGAQMSVLNFRMIYPIGVEIFQAAPIEPCHQHAKDRRECVPHNQWALLWESGDIFFKAELLICARSHGILWELCSNNRGSEESDGAVAQSGLCYVTCGPRNICSPSSLDMCGMNRALPGESGPFACFNPLQLSASSLLPSFSSRTSLLNFRHLVIMIFVYFYIVWQPPHSTLCYYNFLCVLSCEWSKYTHTSKIMSMGTITHHAGLLLWGSVEICVVLKMWTWQCWNMCYYLPASLDSLRETEQAEIFALLAACLFGNVGLSTTRRKYLNGYWMDLYGSLYRYSWFPGDTLFSYSATRRLTSLFGGVSD